MTKNFLSKKDVVCVVGVSMDSEKYGNRVFFDLKNKGYRVFAVHPEGGEISGERRYGSLEEVSNKISLVVFVVPPSVTEKLVVECVKIGIKKVWMQPGSESEKAINFCEKNGIELVHNACVMVRSDQGSL